MATPNRAGSSTTSPPLNITRRGSAVRTCGAAGWSNGPGAPGRGSDDYVAVSWERAAELLAGELHRVYAEHGADHVFGGSYGWASAGRFHHAQSQLHRFLNTLGGYVRSVNTYSYGTAEVLL